MQEINLPSNFANTRFALVAAKFNAPVVNNLIAGVKQALESHAVAEQALDLIHVAGAFELPLAAQRLAQTGRYQAVIALGAVIRGGTPHFEYISSACAHGLNQAGLQTGVPVVFGVLTTDTAEQAISRADPERGNKGYEVGMAALEMTGFMQAVADLEQN